MNKQKKYAKIMENQKIVSTTHLIPSAAVSSINISLSEYSNNIYSSFSDFGNFSASLSSTVTNSFFPLSRPLPHPPAISVSSYPEYSSAIASSECFASLFPSTCASPVSSASLSSFSYSHFSACCAPSSASASSAVPIVSSYQWLPSSPTPVISSRFLRFLTPPSVAAKLSLPCLRFPCGTVRKKENKNDNGSNNSERNDQDGKTGCRFVKKNVNREGSQNTDSLFLDPSSIVAKCNDNVYSNDIDSVCHTDVGIASNGNYSKQYCYDENVSNISDEYGCERELTTNYTSNCDNSSLCYNNIARKRYNSEGLSAADEYGNVYLHVYDLDSNVSPFLNGFFRALGTGLFHGGVEVFDDEYSFGQTLDKFSGITKNIPKCHPVHIYRETVFMGKTHLQENELEMLLENLKLSWSGVSYNILTKNCLNFADQFCNLLGVGSIPSWVLSLQMSAIRASYNLNNIANTVKDLKRSVRMSNTFKNVSNLFVSPRTGIKALSHNFFQLANDFTNYMNSIEDENEIEDYNNEQHINIEDSSVNNNTITKTSTLDVTFLHNKVDRCQEGVSTEEKYFTTDKMTEESCVDIKEKEKFLIESSLEME